MDKVIVYLDDALHAQQQLLVVKDVSQAPKPGATHWVLVACAPRMTHRISKWVSHRARENWRAKWADRLFGEIVPSLQARGDQVTTVLAQSPLPELTRQLGVEHPGAKVLDVRRPKAGQDEGKDDRWHLPGAMMGMGALLVMAAD